MEHLAACLACGRPSDDSPVVHVRRDDRLVRCSGCGLLYANPQYTLAELAPLYTTEYYDEHKNLETDYRERDYHVHRPLHRTVVRDLLRRYPRLQPSPGRAVRVLDFGCGVGYFLESCQQVGMDCLGMDFSDVAARYAKQRFGLTVLTEPDRALAEQPDRSFDLLTAWQVLEHLRRPRETLREMVRVLKPGGVLCLAVPHLGALGYRLRGGRWFNVTNPTHLSFFKRTNLAAMMRDAGLTHVVRAVFWGGQHDFGVTRSFAQYLVRWANLGNELRLYAERAGA
jgi:2-polyprenyl-3-methyl-5-hydroxy-6-metoxy-1,4-benzoquinol methylase